MKRIAFALCATIVVLSTMAQGTLQERLQGNPKIDSLAKKVSALRSNKESLLRSNYGALYYFDGKYHKTVAFLFTRGKDVQPTPPTGDPETDYINRMNDELLQKRNEIDRQVYEAIRNTCKALTDEATESYCWEYHRNGVDSVRYAIAIGEYQNGDKPMTYQRQREVQYYNAPELLSFFYNTDSRNFGGILKGWGNFRYEYTPDSVYMPREDIVPFNKEAYTQAILPILKQEGITSRQFYVYHDSTYAIKRKERNEIDFVLRDETGNPVQTKSETRGTVYTLHSKAQAYEVLEQIVKATWEYLNDNTGFWFDFLPENGFGDRSLYEFFDGRYLSRIPEFYHIYLHTNGEEYNIMIAEGKGDMMIPAEWQVIKSWKNGKVTYDKKALKNLTAKQARERTSSHTSITTRNFEPLD